MKIQVLAFLLAAFAATSAQADFFKVVSTNDLTCTGTKPGEENITLRIYANSAKKVTTLEIRGGLNRDIINRKDLSVQSEGGLYIQQVSNELNYNLFLSGDGLTAAFEGIFPVKVRLTGTLDIFDKNDTYTLSCAGTLLE